MSNYSLLSPLFNQLIFYLKNVLFLKQLGYI